MILEAWGQSVRTTRFLLAVVLAASLRSAQNVSSTLKGAVHDQSGGAIASAECTLANQATSLKSTVATSADGTFVFLNVLAGTYELTVRGTGFKTFKLDQIVVTSSEFHSLEGFGDTAVLVCRLSTAALDTLHVKASEDRGRVLVCRADYAAVYCTLADRRSPGFLWAPIASSGATTDA